MKRFGLLFGSTQGRYRVVSMRFSLKSQCADSLLISLLAMNETRSSLSAEPVYRDD
jgi:hypothetical protein